MVKNPHDAEEVVQDTFLNVYQGLTQLEDVTKFKSWLAEIARNRARNHLRKQRGDTVSIDDVSEQISETQDSPDERIDTAGTERINSPNNRDASAERQGNCPCLLSGGRELR